MLPLFIALSAHAVDCAEIVEMRDIGLTDEIIAATLSDLAVPICEADLDCLRTAGVGQKVIEAAEKLVDSAAESCAVPPTRAEPAGAQPLTLPAAGSSEAVEDEVVVDVVELQPMSFAEERRFRRSNLLGGWPIALFAGSVPVAVGGLVLAFSDSPVASDTGAAIVIGGVAMFVACPVLQAVGTLGAAASLREHGVRAPVFFAVAGVTLVSLGVGYPLGVGLLAAQSSVNRAAFIHAYGRPPGHSGPTLSVQLLPMSVPGGGGLALSGQW